MSTGTKWAARVVGDFTPKGPNRANRRKLFHIERKQVKPDGSKKYPGIKWKSDRYKSKNTPVHWELQEAG